MYKKIVIGVDESYTKTGISIAADGKLLKIKSINFKHCKNKSEKRLLLHATLNTIITNIVNKTNEIIIICERIRTFSHVDNAPKKVDANAKQAPAFFISTNFIKATGALIATIVDTAYLHNIIVYSVDTRSWKSQVVGKTTAIKGDKKLMTIHHICGLGFEKDISYYNKKNVLCYNDDAADSACIALYGFIPAKRQALKKEE